MTVTAKKEDVWIPTSCNMCFNNCSIRVHKVDGVVVKIEGNPDSPIGNGRVCGKGASAIMQLYDPNRKTKPMKRTNPKKGFNEDPGWVEISWDEAYTLAAQQLKKYMEINPKYIMFTSSVSQFTSQMPFVLLGTMAIGTQFFTSGICGAAIHNTLDRFCGTGNAAPDYELCKYVLQFGTQAGTVTRHGTNMTAIRFAEAREKGCKFVNVDPRISGGAEKADVWLPIRPGTDGALAMALAYVLVHELDLYDKEYLKKYTNGPDLVDIKTGHFVRDPKTNKPYVWDPEDGQAKTIDDKTIKDKALTGAYTVNGVKCKPSFQLYMEHLRKFTPEYAEKATTIPAAKIREVAKGFGEAACIGQTITIDGHVLPYRPAAADCFSGVTRHRNSHLTCWAITFLNVLVGSCNVPGGYISFGPVGHGYPETGKPNFRPGVYEEDNMLECLTMVYPWPHSPYGHDYKKKVEFIPDWNASLTSLQPMNLVPDAHLTFNTQLEPEKYKQQRCKLLFVFATNAVKNWGRLADMEEFMKSYEYVIVSDMYLSDTSYFADLFLPEAQFMERYDTFPSMANHHLNPGSLTTPHALTIRQPVVKARDGAPASMDMFTEIAARIGVLDKWNGVLNFMWGLSGDNALDYMKKYKFEEVLDRCYKEWAGPDKGLEWFKKNGVLTWPRKVDEIYLYPFTEARVPVYLEAPVKFKPQVEAEVKRVGIPWGTLENYDPLPGWYPCHHFEIRTPGYDLMPVYYTSALNVDSWGHRNPWIDEINRNEPYGYSIEINRKVAEARGFKTGDTVILETAAGDREEGRLMLVDGIHPEALAVGGGSWNTKSKYDPIARGKGTAICNLMEFKDLRMHDMASAAWDQCVRVKVIKKAKA